MTLQANEERHVTGLGIYDWMARRSRLSYRGKIMAMAFLGTHIPLLALAGWFAFQSAETWRGFAAGLGVALLATLGGTAFTLYVLDQLLRPVALTSRALRAYRTGRTLSLLPRGYADAAGTLMDDAAGMMEHLERLLGTLEYVDEATGLPNRRRFLELVEASLALDRPVSVIAVRFGNHDRIAETLNLPEAEAAARRIAERLAANLLPGETLARVGEADFAVLAPPPAEPGAAASELAARLARCAGALTVGGVEVRPRLLAGLAAAPADADAGAAVLDHALAAAAQATDVSPVAIHSPEARRAARARFELEQDLRRALREDEFRLHFQPVVEMRDGRARASGAEALIRWERPGVGLTSPGEFIPAAEASGLIEPIGLWVLRAACAQLHRWDEEGRGDLRLAVNLSARQFADPALARHVAEALSAARVSPDRLEIELTETAAMADADRTRRVFSQLRDQGVSIAIDDFGAGYASMSHLRRLPFDKLKIDREFVTDVQASRDSQAICGALIELARGLDLSLLAEGVETEEEVRWLTNRGCRIFQGYWFARPMPAPEFGAAVDRLPTLPRAVA